MVFYLVLSIIFRCVAYGIAFFVGIFQGIGLNWLTVVTALAVLSLLCRLFLGHVFGRRLMDAAEEQSYKGAFEKGGKRSSYNGKYAKTGVSGNRSNLRR